MVDKMTNGKPIVTEQSVALQQLSAHPQQATFLDCVGFTLVELIVVVAVLTILAALALPSFNDFVTSAKNKSCLADLRTIDQAITAYIIENNARPASLGAVGFGGKLDPWKRLYVYKNLTDADAVPRDDSAFNPLNTDYDLYSTGSDGASAQAYDGVGSPDDLARVNNGSYYSKRDDL